MRTRYSIAPLSTLSAQKGNNPVRRSALYCLLAGCTLLLSACQSKPSPDNFSAAAPSGTTGPEDLQTAYRVRSDFNVPLNLDAGWAAAINSPAQVVADQPFRIRFEVATNGHASLPRRYRLEFRRNEGNWQALPAENFPQPSKKLELELEPGPTGELTDRWEIVEGSSSDLSWQSAVESGYLRAETQDQALLAMGRYATHWEAVEFAVELRLPGGRSTQAGIVFGYKDASNYQRLDVDSSGAVSIIQVENGRETVMTRHQTEPVLDRFFELKLIQEGDALIVEFDDEALVFRAELDQRIPLSTFGLYLPAGARADFESIEIEGMPRSPRTSIVASKHFKHGAPTKNLLAGSRLAFGGGAGVSFAATTPEWRGAGTHGEWEFPIVIRYFSDEAAVNAHGDVFEYRLVDESGRPLASESYATASLIVPDGHLGGTFVETPMRIGPWQASDGSLYFLMEPAETWNNLMVVKSSDGGRSWREMDGVNRPATGDLEGFASRLIGDRIHMLHQTSDDVLYHVFRTVDHPQQADSWAIRDEWLASPEEPPTQVADLAVRSDGSVVAVYGGPEKIHYQIRSPAGKWSAVTVIDADRGPNLSGPAVVLGRGDVVHLAYTGSDGTAWYRRILPDGSMTERVQFAADLGTRSDDVGSILPLVYFEASGEVALLYRLATGQLCERRVGPDDQWSTPVRVSDRIVVQNAVDAEQTGADAIAFGDSLQVLFIEEGSGHLYHSSRTDQGDWSEAVCVVDDKNVQWVRGTLIQNPDGTPAYGYVIDGGADGGSGMNQYGQISLGDL